MAPPHRPAKALPPRKRDGRPGEPSMIQTGTAAATASDRPAMAALTLHRETVRRLVGAEDEERLHARAPSGRKSNCATCFCTGTCCTCGCLTGLCPGTYGP